MILFDDIGNGGLHDINVEIDHPPGAPALSQRNAVMHLTRIDGDDMAGFSLHHAAPTQRFLRAALHKADAELVVHVTWKRAVAIRNHGSNTGHGGFRHEELTAAHEKLALPLKSATLSQAMRARQGRAFTDACR